MRKSAALSLLLTCLYFSAGAQDIIVKTNKKTIEGKVIEVGVDQILYKISKEENSAVFAILKREVNRIEFENGQTVFMNDKLDAGNPKPVRVKEVRQPMSYGRNFINISPFKALDSGPGFGISYELLVDKQGYFGIILPLAMTIPDSYNFVFDTYNTGSAMFYAAPGLKIYPFGQRKVTYAVGPNIFVGSGHRWENTSQYDPVTGYYTTVEGKTRLFRLGMIVNNYVNFQVTPNFQIGLNAGLGSRYFDEEKNRDFNRRTRGMQITGEFNFNLGFRF